MTSVDYILIVVTCLLGIADVAVMAINTEPSGESPKDKEKTKHVKK